MAEARATPLSDPTRRLTELVRLAERRLADAFGGKLARVYAWGIAVSYALAVALGAMRPHAAVSQALAALAWIPGGLVALAAARDQRRLDDEAGVVALVRQRGFDARELELARWLAAVTRMARVLGYPALALALVAGARASSVNAAVSAAGTLLGAAVFVALTSLLLATLARASALLSGGRGRLVLACAVLLPEFAQALLPWMPSVPRALARLLGLLVQGGP